MPRPALLPVLAIMAIAGSTAVIVKTRPDRALATPARAPASPLAADGRSVAGAGVVEPASELIQIGAEVPGIVARVAVRPGDRVAAGAPLFAIDDRAARATLNEAQARANSAGRAVEIARTNLQVAQRELGLYTGGGDPRAISKQELVTRQGVVDEARAQLAAQNAQRREAEAARDTARTTLDRLVVRAPMAATVLQVRTRPGQYAPAGPQSSAGDPLVTLGVITPLHVRIDIDENEIGRVALNRPASISPKGMGSQRTTVTFVRAEPLVVPKRSLTNAATERVDVRVLQLIYAVPAAERGYFVGQQVDGFVPARAAG